MPPVLYFEPMFNKQYSWFNSLFQLGIGRGVHIVFSLIVTALIYLFYSYLSNRAEVTKLVNVMFVFLFSGAVCSLIDKIFWDGSLDYISVKGLFTFDLKDVYLKYF